MLKQFIVFLGISVIFGLFIGGTTFSREVRFVSINNQNSFSISGNTFLLITGELINIAKFSIPIDRLQGKPLYISCELSCQLEPYEDGYIIHSSK